MTGSPLLRLALILIALALLAIPLARITARPTAPVAPASQPTTEPITTRLVSFAVTATTPPATLTLDATARTLATDPNAPFTTELPTATTDIIVRATWPETTAHALRVVASVDGLPLVDQTFWTTDTLADVLTIPGLSTATEPPGDDR